MNDNNLAEKFRRDIEQNQPIELSTEQNLSQNNIVNSSTQRPPEVVPTAVQNDNTIDDVIKARHDTSIKEFPNVPVDDDEYVVIRLSRHSIGVIGVVIISILIFVLLTSAWIILCFTPTKLMLSSVTKASLNLIFLPLILLSLVGGYIGYYTYDANHLVITNERAIQIIVTGILNNRRQTINLKSIEDISYSQVGIFQHAFGYGTVRLSTIGDETTYTFNLSRQPARVSEVIGDIAECARNNVPISEELYQQARKLNDMM